MMRIVIIALTAFLVTGCAPSVTKIDSSQAGSTAQLLTYAQDKRTGLCFATVGAHKFNDPLSGSLTITWVPCNPEVLALIK